MCRSRFLAGLLAAIVCVYVAGTSAAAPTVGSCSPGLGIGLVEFPKNTDDPRAKTYVVDHVRPGAHFSRRLQVCNGTDKPITVSLYAGAALLRDGTFEIVEGRAGNELARWIRVDPQQVTVPPGERILARATFTVPSDAESGERYAVVLAELPAKRQSTGVQVSSRVGVRVYLDVGPGGAPHSDFAIDSLQAARDTDGKGLVRAQVHNTGLRAIDISGTLSLRDGPAGLTGGPYPASLGTTLAPGDSEPVLVKIDTSIADGPWTAELTLRSGLLERRVQANLTFPSTPGSEAPPVDVEQLAVADEPLNPVPALLSVGVLLLAIGAFVTWRRRTTSSQ